MTQVPDATVAILAALAVMILGWIMFYVSQSFNKTVEGEDELESIKRDDDKLVSRLLNPPILKPDKKYDPQKKKSAYMAFRATPEMDRLIRRAARLDGRPVSSFLSRLIERVLEDENQPHEGERK
jgi:Tfp pilus assembly protein PilO